MMLYHEYLLLKMLTDSNSLLSISQIVEQLKITQRTAYLSISGVNEWLESRDLNKIMTVRNHGYYVQPYEIDKIKSCLKYDLQQGNVKLPSFIRKIAIEFV
ncbi:MAG: HTH domain-containing protein, partial [Candidatus Schmidhempelia sp.]|nr:HTH domain-containing protein [Candidatus Schmidhempelia sp.]